MLKRIVLSLLIGSSYGSGAPNVSNASGTLPIANGGTGQTSASAAAHALGLGTADSPTFTGVMATGVLTTGSGPTTLTDATGKVLSAALNTVAIAQGGTGSATQNFVDLSSTQNAIAGSKTFTGPVTFTPSATGVTINGGNNVLAMAGAGPALNFNGANATISGNGDNGNTTICIYGNGKTACLNNNSNTFDFYHLTNFSVSSSLTASTTHSVAGATVCTKDFCNVGTVANTGDAVEVAPSSGISGIGHHQQFYNAGAHTMNLYPDTTSSVICVETALAGGVSCGAAGTSTTIIASAILDCWQADTTVSTWICR